MNKILALLLVFLMLFSAYAWREQKAAEAAQAREASLLQQAQQLRDTLASRQSELDGRDPIIAELRENEQALMEEFGVWHARVEDLQNLLSD